MGNKKAVKVLIAAHKPYPVPDDRAYVPVFVGAECHSEKLDDMVVRGFTPDNTGENISSKNPSFCELTGVYWGWKNIDADFIGMAHYRRYFGDPAIKKGEPMERIISGEKLEKLLEKKSVVVPKKRKYYIETLYSHYAHTHYALHLDETRNIIAEKYPEYLKTFDKVMKQRSGYMFNMQIMSKELNDAYCEWLFDILFELERRLGEMDYDFFQGRFYGRVSEIIFNVWLTQQIKDGVIKKRQIAELPCVYTEKINWWKKGAAFLSAKLFHKKYKGSF